MAGPVLLITGASSGIGAATARHAAAAGYRLVLAARRQEELEVLARELGGDERALAVPSDVTEWDDQQRLARAALDAFGRIDAVFANAGFGAARGFLESTPEHWRSMVLTNIYGVALTIRATLTALKKSSGHVVLTGSVAGRKALPGSLYSATKWAVTAMGESLRQEVQRHGRPRDGRRAGDGRHAVLRQPGRRLGAADRGRRCRGRHVRTRPAAARRRERDPRAAHVAIGIDGGVGMGYRAATIDELGDGFMRKVREPLGVTAFGVNALVLPAGTEWFNHRHERQDELYVVQRGRAGFDVDGETFELGPGGLCHVEAATARQVWNAGEDDLVLVIVGGKDGYVGRDGQLVDPDDLERRIAAGKDDPEAVKRR